MMDGIEQGEISPIAMIQLRDAESLQSKPMAAWLNTSGIDPIEFKVVILPKKVEEVTKGGVYLPDSAVDSEKFSTTKGKVIAVSGLAFNYATPDEYETLGGKKPKPGQTVHYAKYAGVWIKGDDGVEYLVVNDKDILGIAPD